MTDARHGGRTEGTEAAPSRSRRLLLRLFRVDERPEPPPGSPESLRVFRASPGYFRYKLVGWGLGQTGALIGLIVSTLGFLPIAFWAPREGFEFLEFGPWTDFTRALGPLLLVLFLVQLVGSFAVLRLGYEMRWYMVSDRALRIRHGIFSVREQTMTVVNIQNMAVKRGPLQRLFGIADLEIRTASGGGSDDDEDSLSRGLLEGLDDAEKVRDLLLASLRRSRDAGLGDPDDAAAAPEPGPGPAAEAPPAGEGAPPAGEGAPPAGEDAPPAGTVGDPALAAARDLLAECRALRRALAGAADAP